MATLNPDMAKGVDTVTAITKYRFVKLVPTALGDPVLVAQCTADGEGAYGVSMFSVSLAEIGKGKGVSVINEGRMILEAGAAVAVNDLVATDSQGRAIPADSGDVVLGRCDADPAAAAGNHISVMLSDMVSTLP